jgi:hypothetical protein
MRVKHLAQRQKPLKQKTLRERFRLFVPVLLPANRKTQTPAPRTPIMPPKAKGPPLDYLLRINTARSPRSPPPC